MQRFKTYYAATLDSLVELLNLNQTLFSTVVYIGPSKPRKTGDKAFVAILDFSYHPVITQEDIVMMKEPSIDVDMDEFPLALTA